MRNRMSLGVGYCMCIGACCMGVGSWVLVSAMQICMSVWVCVCLCDCDYALTMIICVCLCDSVNVLYASLDPCIFVLMLEQKKISSIR